MQFSKPCPICGNPIIQNKRHTKRYCSDACKAKAWRVNHTPSEEKALTSKEKKDRRVTKMKETKASNVSQKVCPVCKRAFIVDGFTASKIYCSDACSQRAYRNRLEEKQKATNPSAEPPSGEPFTIWINLDGLRRANVNEYKTYNRAVKTAKELHGLTRSIVVIKDCEGYEVMALGRNVLPDPRNGALDRLVRDFTSDLNIILDRSKGDPDELARSLFDMACDYLTSNANNKAKSAAIVDTYGLFLDEHKLTLAVRPDALGVKAVELAEPPSLTAEPPSRSEPQSAPNDYSFSGLKGAMSVIDRFIADFTQRYEMKPIVTPLVVAKGREYWINREDQPGSILMFQNARRLSNWLADYLTNGKPNFAALRYR